MTMTPDEYRDKIRREQHNEAQKRYRKNHPDRVKEIDKRYYYSHHDERIAKQRERRRLEREREKYETI